MPVETDHGDGGHGLPRAAAFRTIAANDQTPSVSVSTTHANRQRARQVERREDRRRREQQWLLPSESPQLHREEEDEEERWRNDRSDRWRREGGEVSSVDCSVGGRLPPLSLRPHPNGIPRKGGGAGADAADTCLTDHSNKDSGTGGVVEGIRRKPRGFLLRRMDERKASASAAASPLGLDGATSGKGTRTDIEYRRDDGRGGGVSPSRSVREVIDAFNNHRQAMDSSVNVSALSVGSCFDAADVSFPAEGGEHCDDDDDDDWTVRTPVSVLVNRFERASPFEVRPVPVGEGTSDNEDDYANSVRRHSCDRLDRNRVGRDNAWRRRQSHWTNRHLPKKGEEENKNVAVDHERQQQKRERSKSKGVSSLRCPSPPPLPPSLMNHDIVTSEESSTFHQTRKQQGTTTNRSTPGGQEWRTRERQLHQYGQRQHRPEEEEDGTKSHQRALPKQSAKDFWVSRVSRVQGDSDGGGLPNRDAQWSGGHRLGGGKGNPDAICSSSLGGSSSGTCSGGAYDFSSVCTPTLSQSGGDAGGSRRVVMGRIVTDNEEGDNEACREVGDDDGEDKAVVLAPRAIASPSLSPATSGFGGCDEGTSSFPVGPRSDDPSSEMDNAGRGRAGQSSPSMTQSPVWMRRKHDLELRNGITSSASGVTTANLTAPSGSSEPQAEARGGTGAAAVVAEEPTSETEAIKETQGSTTIPQFLPLPFRPRFFRASAMSEIAKIAAATASTSSSQSTIARVVTPPPQAPTTVPVHQQRQPKSVVATGNAPPEGLAAVNRDATNRSCGDNRLAVTCEREGKNDCNEVCEENLGGNGVEAEGEKGENDLMDLGGRGHKRRISRTAALIVPDATASVAVPDSRTRIVAPDDERFLECTVSRAPLLSETSLPSHREALTKAASYPAGDTSAPEDEHDRRIHKPEGRTNRIASLEATRRAQERPPLSTSETVTNDIVAERNYRINAGKMLYGVTFRQRYKENLYAPSSSFCSMNPTPSPASLHIAVSRATSEGESAEAIEHQGPMCTHSTRKDGDTESSPRRDEQIQSNIDWAKRNTTGTCSGSVECRRAGSFRQRYEQYLRTASLLEAESPSISCPKKPPIVAVVQTPPMLLRKLRPPPSFPSTDVIETACSTFKDSSNGENTDSDDVDRDSGENVEHDESSFRSLEESTDRYDVDSESRDKRSNAGHKSSSPSTVDSDSQGNRGHSRHDSSSPSAVPSVLQQSTSVSMRVCHSASPQSRGGSSEDCDNFMDGTCNEKDDNQSSEIDSREDSVVEIEGGCERSSIELDCSDIVIVPQRSDEIEMEVLEMSADLTDNVQVQDEPFCCDTSRISRRSEVDCNHSTEKENRHSHNVCFSQNSSSLSPTAALWNSNRALTNEKATSSDSDDAHCASGSAPLSTNLMLPPVMLTSAERLSTLERNSLDSRMAGKHLYSPVLDPASNNLNESYEAQLHGGKNGFEDIIIVEGDGIDLDRGDDLTRAQEATGISEGLRSNGFRVDENHKLSPEGIDAGPGNVQTKDLSRKNENDGKNMATKNLDTPQEKNGDVLDQKRVTFSPVEQRISIENFDEQANDSVADYSCGESDADSLETALSSLVERDDKKNGETNLGGNDDDNSSVGTSVSSLTNVTDANAYATMNSTLACLIIPALRCSTCE